MGGLPLLSVSPQGATQPSLGMEQLPEVDKSIPLIPWEGQQGLDSLDTGLSEVSDVSSILRRL